MNGRLMQALAALMAEMEPVPKSKVGKVVAKSGASYEYSYYGLVELADTARPLLGKHGLAMVQCPRILDRILVVETTVQHIESGEFITGQWPVGPLDMSPQQAGSASSYARRYSAAMLLGALGADDDDGAAASKPARTPRKKPVADTRPMHERLVGALAACHSVELVDRLMAQQSTLSAMEGLDNLERTLVHNAAEARKRAISAGEFPGDTPTHDAAARKGTLTSSKLAIAAGDDLYWKFLTLTKTTGEVIESKEQATAWQQQHFGVDTRAKIDGDPVLEPIARSHLDEWLLWRDPP